MTQHFTPPPEPPANLRTRSAHPPGAALSESAASDAAEGAISFRAVLFWALLAVIGFFLYLLLA